MKLSKFSVAMLCMCSALTASALPPIKYVTVVRNNEGKALASREMSFVVEILDSPTAERPLYTELHNTASKPDGTVTLLIGNGRVTSDTAFDQIDWSAQRYVKVSVDSPVSGVHCLSVSELGGAPIAMQSEVSHSLVTTSPNGTPWELKITDNGTLYWECMGEIPDTPPAYYEDRIPENLYFIGTFNNWTVADALPMEKISKYVFTITRTFEPDEVFKFVPTQTWDNAYDWSGKQMKIGTAVPLVERGNTPKFTGERGTYRLTVDFHSYTMTIDKL